MHLDQKKLSVKNILPDDAFHTWSTESVTTITLYRVSQNQTTVVTQKFSVKIFPHKYLYIVASYNLLWRHHSVLWNTFKKKKLLINAIWTFCISSAEILTIIRTNIISWFSQIALTRWSEYLVILLPDNFSLKSILLRVFTFSQNNTNRINLFCLDQSN